MNLRELEKKYALTFWGLLLSVAYIFYSEFLKSENTELTWTLLSNSRVFHVSEKIDSLTVRYQGRDLLKTNENLNILTMSIKNTGTTNITEGMYNQIGIFGFTIKQGKIIGTPEIISRSEDYISSMIKLNDSLNTVILPKTMLDKSDEYIVKILYLASIDTLNIIPVGKISGVKQSQIYYTPPKDKPKWYKSIIPLILGFVTSIFILDYVSSIPSKIRRNKRKSKLKKFYKMNPDIKIPASIENLFVNQGKDFIVKIGSVFTNSELFKDIKQTEYEIMKALQKVKTYDLILDKEYDSEYCRNGGYSYPLRRLVQGSANEFFNHPNNPTSGEPKNELKPEVITAMNLFLEFLKHN